MKQTGFPMRCTGEARSGTCCQRPGKRGGKGQGFNEPEQVVITITIVTTISVTIITTIIIIMVIIVIIIIIIVIITIIITIIISSLPSLRLCKTWPQSPNLIMKAQSTLLEEPERFLQSSLF